jgi:hypothetical protein
VNEAKVPNQFSLEMERAAAQKARGIAKASMWDSDVAVFFFAILAIVIILSLQKVEVEFTSPSAIFGLAMGWVMGWSKEKQAYEHFYDEELSKLEKQVEETMSALEKIVIRRVREARSGRSSDSEVGY